MASRFEHCDHGDQRFQLIAHIGMLIKELTQLWCHPFRAKLPVLRSGGEQPVVSIVIRLLHLAFVTVPIAIRSFTNAMSLAAACHDLQSPSPH